MKKKIFTDLSIDQVIKLEKLLTEIFLELSSIASRRNILLNAGVDEYLIATMDFNININEFTTNLVATLKSYSLSSNKLDYHPLVALLSYILYQPERFNLDDTDLKLCEQIINIGKGVNNRVNQVENTEQAKENNSSTTVNTSPAQIGKYIIHIKEGKDIHIGDRINGSSQDQDVSQSRSVENEFENVESNENNKILSKLTKKLEYARSQGDEGDRNTGSYYTYNVWLENVDQQIRTQNNNQQNIIVGKWRSQVYKEINLFGLRVDYPWGKEKTPYGEFTIFIEVSNEQIEDYKIQVDRYDDSPNNYAATKVQELIDREVISVNSKE